MSDTSRTSILHTAAFVMAVVIAVALLAGLGALGWGEQHAQAEVLDEVKKLLASDAEIGDVFGNSVAVSGDIAVVGANGEDAGGENSGAAYVFQRNLGGPDNWGEVKKLTASDAQAKDQFGYSVAISGDIAVVGAYQEDAGGSSAGAAYIFRRDEGGTDNWGEVKKLTASDAQGKDQFGYSVAVDGGTAILGARYEDAGGDNAGAAYVFRRDEGGADNWGEVKKLTASDAQADDNFGISVAVHGDTALLGAHYEDAGGDFAGAAYVYQRDQGGTGNWGEVKKLTASDAQASDLFGVSVAVSGNTAVVGAYAEDAGGSAAGAAYVFERSQGGADNWGEVTKLTASDAEGDDRFGVSVAVSGDAALVGAYYEDAAGGDAGAAYVFGRDEGGADNWSEVKKLTASDAQADDRFGWKVALSGDTAIIGSNLEDAGGVSAGAAYVFQEPPPTPTPTPCPTEGCPPTETPTDTPTPTPTPTPGGPEMALRIVSGGACDPQDQTDCTVQTGRQFVVSIDAATIPASGYILAQGWVSYGDLLGDQSANGAVKGGTTPWPDCDTSTLLVGHSDEEGNSKFDSYRAGCLTGLLPPQPVSFYEGSLYTITLTCPNTPSIHLVELIRSPLQPAGTSGALFLDGNLIQIVPKVNSLTILCTFQAPTGTPPSGHNINGTLFESLSGYMRGATVRLDPLGSQAITSVQDGSFTFFGVPDGTYTIVIVSPSCTPFGCYYPIPVNVSGQKVSLSIYPKIFDADTDGDTIPNSSDTDDDNDGCSDGRENASDETLGGLRNPHNPWDFYDVAGSPLPPQNGAPDGVVDLPNDILGVIQHHPAGTLGYDVQFDRGPWTGPNSWNETQAPDGVIDLPNDILGVILQFQHSCQ